VGLTGRAWKVGSKWHVQGRTDSGQNLDLELRRIHGREVLVPHDPANPAQVYEVRRPIESASSAGRTAGTPDA
jgi:hypothetical protein